MVKLFFLIDPWTRNTLVLSSYGTAVDQRALGALEASKYGAIGVIVRSMTLG